MPTSPTQLSMRLMRTRGFYVIKVEHWNPFAKIRQDLCGGDLLALKEGEPPTLIQATTAENRNKRVAKLNTLESAALWVKSGCRLLVHGWRPLTKSRRRYEVDEIEWEGAPCKLL